MDCPCGLEESDTTERLSRHFQHLLEKQPCRVFKHQKGALTPPSEKPQVRKGALTHPSEKPQVRKGALTPPSEKPQVRKGALTPPSERAASYSQ